MKKTEAQKAYMRAYYQAHRDKMQSDHKAWQAANVEHRREYRRAIYEANLDEERERARQYKRLHGRMHHLKSKYGMTIAEYDAMYAKQKGECAICKTSIEGKGNAKIDHDHRTGKTRGLLCNRCNRALGLLYDDCDVLRSAISYLCGFGD